MMTYFSFTENYAQKTLALLGENCTRSQIFTAISSSHGTAVFSTEFPDLDPNYCLRHKGYQRSVGISSGMTLLVGWLFLVLPAL